VYDGQTKEMYIVQARPETVQAERDENVIKDYELEGESEVVLKGEAVGSKIGSGKAHILKSPKEIDQFEEGEVLVTDMTDPDWEPIMKKAGAIITNKGGRTSHAAIVSREIGVPAVIGTENATSQLSDGQEVTVDCSTSTGRIWEGKLDYNVDEHHLDSIPDTDTDVQVNIGEPSEVFHVAQLPVEGVGLAREEFIISSHVGVHPLQLMEEGREEEQRKKGGGGGREEGGKREGEEKKEGDNGEKDLFNKQEAAYRVRLSRMGSEKCMRERRECCGD
jgi:pyruvate,water dikinase